MTQLELNALCEGISPVIANTHTLLVKVFMALAMQPCVDLPKLIADLEIFDCSTDESQKKQIGDILELLRQLSLGDIQKS